MLGHSYIIVVSTAALGTSDPLDPPFTLLTTPNLPVPPKHPAPPIAPATISCNNPHISSFACRHSCTDNSNSLRTPHGFCLDALALALRIRAACHCRGLTTAHSTSQLPALPLCAGIPPRCFWDAPLTSCLAASAVRSHAWPARSRGHFQAALRLSLLPLPG